MQQQQEQRTRELRRFNVVGPCANVLVSGNTGSWRLERPQVDFEKCVKCGICSTYCPANVITIHKEEKECVQIDWRFCKGCGICANECPKGSITMVDERSGR